MRFIQAGVVAFGLAGLMMAAPSAGAQRCLHGPDETGEQLARRKQAVSFSRDVHNQQVAGRRSTGIYRSQHELQLTQAVPGGFEFKLRADENGYAFSVVDTTDPCRFAYFSNEAGVIYQGQALQ